MRPIEQSGEHLADLIAIIVDGLLAEDDEAGLFGLDHGFQKLRDGERFGFAFGFYQDAAIGAHGERIA